MTLIQAFGIGAVVGMYSVLVVILFVIKRDEFRRRDKK